MQKTIIIISIILALIIAGIIGASFYFYNVAVKRAEKDFLNSDPNLAVSTPQKRENGLVPSTLKR